VTSAYGKRAGVASRLSSFDGRASFALQAVPVIGATARFRPHPSSPRLRYCGTAPQKKVASAPAASEYRPASFDAKLWRLEQDGHALGKLRPMGRRLRRRSGRRSGWNPAAPSAALKILPTPMGAYNPPDPSPGGSMPAAAHESKSLESIVEDGC